MIPKDEKFMYPVLCILKDGSPRHRDELRKECAKIMHLTEQDLEERISSNRKYKIVDRLQWSTNYLLRAGLVTRPQPGVEQITDAGIALLNTGITDITRQFLREHYASYALFEKETREAFKQRSKSKKDINDKDEQVMNQEDASLDNDILESVTYNDYEVEDEKPHNDEQGSLSYIEEKESSISEEIELLREGLIEELVGIINDFDRDSFKNLLLELIPRIGYSSVFEEYNIDAKFSHDVELSGFVNIDELGLNKFFLAAHNKIEEDINLIDVQSFIGAISSLGISNGVYITTSKFSEEAKLLKTHGAVRVILLDGREIAKLMIKFNIGVKTRKTFEIKDVDQEYLFTHLTQA